MNNVVSMRAGGQMAPITPQSFEDVQRMAKMAVVAGITPRDRKDTDESAIAKATAAILQGLECDIPPMQALQGMAVINGKVLMYGDLLTALLWSKNFKVKKWIEGVGDARVGHAEITRPDGTVIHKTFSVAQAKQARLWDTRPTVKKQWNGNWEEKPNDSPWFRFPERMLEWRPFGYCVKDGASDATHGMLVREEAAPEYNQIVDITPEPTTEDSGTLDVPDIPDVPDVDDDAIADPGSVVAKLTEDLAEFGNSPEAKVELSEQYSDLIDRLPDDWKGKAQKLLEA